MAYNISAFKIKNIKNLCIDEKSLNKILINDSELKIDNDKQTFRLNYHDQHIIGYIVDDIFHIKHVECYGEFSGDCWNKMFIPILRQTKGCFEVILIWENCEFIERVTCLDGSIKEVEIQL